MESDNPKKDSAVDFLRDIIPAFAGAIEEQKALNLGIRQRSTRSLSQADEGRVFVSVYGRPKGYETDTLRYHHVFPVFVLLESTAKHITALNPFYLPRSPREIIVNAFLNNLTSTRPDINTRTTFNYNLIKNNSQGAIIKPAIKKYIIEIKPNRQTKPPAKPKRQTKGYLREAYEYAKNQAKWEAADEWCKDRGYEFKVFTEKELGIKYGT